ncbi:MAG: hypothetical protein ACOCV1_05225 [Bacillota bacterium]
MKFFRDEIDKVAYEQDEKIKDRFLNVRYRLWNSLITINGILLSSVSIFTLMNKQISLLSIIIFFISGLASLMLLFFNYYKIKDFYFQLGSNPKNLTKKDALENFKYINIRENAAIVFIFIEIVWLFIMIIDYRIKFFNIGGVNVVEFFNLNAGGVQAFSSILLLIVTTAYVYINSLMHKEMKKERERFENPNINIKFEPITSGAYYNLIIENNSSIPAIDIEFEEYPSLIIFSNVRTDSIGFIKNGINFMAPGQLHKSLFLDVTDSNKIESEIKFRISYKNERGKKYTRNFNFNTEAYKHVYSLGKPFEKEIVSNLKGIKKEIKKIKIIKEE